MKFTIALLLLFCSLFTQAQPIPLPEHPRPDFERSDWLNLNGNWSFAFDSLDAGLNNKWQEGKVNFTQTINVPFPWGSPLSGVADKADIGWYKRKIMVPESWKGKRVFVTVGASDWETTAWLNGTLLGKNQGGYTPFSFELPANISNNLPNELVIRVDDMRRDFTLYGKQGYGNSRGIWQTIYLEARGSNYVDVVHFTPDIDNQTIMAKVIVSEKVKADTSINITIKTPGDPIVFKGTVSKNTDRATFTIPIPNQRLWTLNDPWLYDAEVKFNNDVVKSYFGMRKISVVNLPGTTYSYIALNNQPIYLQLTLDQSYHPEGFYTFPTDAFMKNEIALAKGIGLNGIRTHIKIDIPRKLYWADKLGVLVMADLPNSWGEPNEKMQAESEHTLREMIKRDYNHPAIFSWITFNETWGLRTRVTSNGKSNNTYLPSTQQWVASMYHLAKSLDLSRLVEDNSICCGAGHTQTDINSWHEYLPGWAWEDHLTNIEKNTFAGSFFHFEQGFAQGNQPNINSECGNVWGYDGSTGDVDWSWDYHRMMNSFRQHPLVAGWLYTEHHDVINEWNGYWRFDRTLKYTGLEELVPGMTVNDFHAPFYLSAGNEICKTVQGGETVQVPLHLSVMEGKAIKNNQLFINYKVDFIDKAGETSFTIAGKINVDYQPWMQKTLAPLALQMPGIAGLATVQLTLADADGNILHHNFMNVVVKSASNKPNTTIVEVLPNKYANAEWSQKSWAVMDGLKMNGTGKGYFEYKLPVTAQTIASSKKAYLLFEASAKQLFDKDRSTDFEKGQDYMLGAKVSPHKNPNAYPMTDETRFPSQVKIFVDGKQVATETLPDDPADHRGILSWHSQLKDKKLREAGSYGYLIKIRLNKKQLKTAAAQGFMTLKIETKAQGGLAIYGEDFGRYPINPSLVIFK